MFVFREVTLDTLPHPNMDALYSDFPLDSMTIQASIKQGIRKIAFGRRERDDISEKSPR